MTRQLAQELLPVIQAWADGQKIQVKANMPSGEWQDYIPESGDGDPMFGSVYWVWRIKPKQPKPTEFWIAYRPYKPYPQILERIFVAEENKDNPYWSENGFKVRKFVEVVE